MGGGRLRGLKEGAGIEREGLGHLRGLCQGDKLDLIFGSFFIQSALLS